MCDNAVESAYIVLIGILPAVFGAISICIVWFDLNEEKQAQIARELADRRNGSTISM